MGHHGDEDFDPTDPHFKAAKENRDKLLRAMVQEDKIDQFKGALGDYPMGKLSDEDEGAIRFAVGVEQGKVVLDFGKSVRWIGMSAQEAANLAAIILKHAREAGRATGEAVTMVIGK